MGSYMRRSDFSFFDFMWACRIASIADVSFLAFYLTFLTGDLNPKSLALVGYLASELSIDNILNFCLSRFDDYFWSGDIKGEMTKVECQEYQWGEDVVGRPSESCEVLRLKDKEF